MKITTLTTSALLLIFSNATLAKVSQSQANQLGKQLTSVGAQMSANADGSIPGYTGGLTLDTSADPFKDIYANEKPLFTITSKNVLQYQDKLSDGQLALFAKYPDTYKMPIYKTHRTAAYPKNILAKAKKNATTTELVDGGTGLINFDETIPFAIPHSGEEVIWNHISRFRGGSVEVNSAQLTVQRNGTFTPVRVNSILTSPQYLVDGFDKRKDDNILFYYLQAIKSPARYTGNIFLVHETLDQIKQPRMAWTYNAGQRRVRRAPQVAYDAPSEASEGLRTTDQVDMFNGATDRYDWKLVGKKEIFIPYNSYKIADQSVKYKDIVGVGHINQDYTRYELHRVWQVEATLRAGSRHLYSKRTFYVDEDSWQIALADHYDGRGDLWRTSEGHSLQFVNADTLWYAANTVYDLFSGRYVMDLSNEERDAYRFDTRVTHKNFTTAAIRRMGKR